MATGVPGQRAEVRGRGQLRPGLHGPVGVWGPSIGFSLQCPLCGPAPALSCEGAYPRCTEEGAEVQRG